MRFPINFWNEQPIGAFELDTMPGCSQVCISHSKFIKPDKRGKGLGSQTGHQSINRAKELGYNYMLCTVDSKNTKQIKILENEGWKHLDWFTSTKTENDVWIYGRVI